MYPTCRLYLIPDRSILDGMVFILSQMYLIQKEHPRSFFKVLALTRSRNKVTLVSRKTQLDFLVGGLRATVCRFAMGWLFSTNVNAENQCLINLKCVCEALNRHFWVGAVMHKALLLFVSCVS